MAYNKTVWTDRESEFPNRYKDQNDNVLSLTRDEGVVSSTGTFINAAVMNNIEDGVEEVDLKTDTISRYITATAGSDGDFHINLGSSFTLTEGLTIKVKFPAATNSASNARFSIDNGTTYTNCRMGAVNLTADELQSQVVTMVYDGTNWGFEGTISGSNANGNWQKFSDGTMVCDDKEFDSTFFNTGNCRGTWTFPKAYSEQPFVGATYTQRIGYSGNEADLGLLQVFATSLDLSSASIRQWRVNGNTDFKSGDIIQFSVTARGRWY